jgi:hypothetical protein
MVHFVRAVLASGIAGVDSISVCLAVVITAAAPRNHAGSGFRVDSDLAIAPCAVVGVAKARMPLLMHTRKVAAQ